jgi:hypothetical protein
MSVGRVVSSSTIRDLRFFRRLAALEWQRDIDEWRSEEAGHLFPLRNALKWATRPHDPVGCVQFFAGDGANLEQSEQWKRATDLALHAAKRAEQRVMIDEDDGLLTGIPLSIKPATNGIRAGAFDPALGLAESDQHIARKPCIPPDRVCV